MNIIRCYDLNVRSFSFGSPLCDNQNCSQFSHATHTNYSGGCWWCDACHHRFKRNLPHFMRHNFGKTKTDYVIKSNYFNECNFKMGWRAVAWKENEALPSSKSQWIKFALSKCSYLFKIFTLYSLRYTKCCLCLGTYAVRSTAFWWAIARSARCVQVKSARNKWKWFRKLCEMRQIFIRKLLARVEERSEITKREKREGKKSP